MKRILRTIYIKLLPGFAKRLARSCYLWCSSTIFGLRFPGDRCQCNFCGFKANRFVSCGYDEGVLVEKQVIGGGIRPNGRCPKCFSLDRERQIVVVLNELGLDKTSVVLHVAPEKNLNVFVRKTITQNVHECDLFPEYYRWADNITKQDLTKLTYQANTFDLILCNHVFEHIPQDAIAFAELHRVLKPGGYAILQIPYSEAIEETEEDLENFDPLYQLQRFGQRTHVRIYQKDDYIKRAEASGLVSKFRSPEDLKKHAHLAFDEREGIFLFQKPPQ